MNEREQAPTDVGEGYPEDGQPGTGMNPKEHAENAIPEGDKRGSSEGDPGQATGNPRAAGADGDGSS